MKLLISIATRVIPRHYLQHVSHFFLQIFSLFLRGNRFEDPINGITYRKLLPYGRLKSRENAIAPDSLSLERFSIGGQADGACGNYNNQTECGAAGGCEWYGWNNPDRISEYIKADWVEWTKISDNLANVDLIINCTTIGFGDQEECSPLTGEEIRQCKESTVFFDIIYQPVDTLFQQIARENRKKTMGGLLMNLEQAV